MPFPGNQIFPKKIREISRPEHSETSSSPSRLSTGIWDWLLPSLVSGRETFCNSQTLPEWKLSKEGVVNINGLYINGTNQEKSRVVLFILPLFNQPNGLDQLGLVTHSISLALDI